MRLPGGLLLMVQLEVQVRRYIKIALFGGDDDGWTLEKAEATCEEQTLQHANIRLENITTLSAVNPQIALLLTNRGGPSD